MRIQLLNGALGNQAFQYIFVRFAERYCPDIGPWYFDDSTFFFDRFCHGGPLRNELKTVFGMRLNLLSDYFDADVWAEIIRRQKTGRSMPQVFRDVGIPLTVLAETNDFSYDGEILWTPANQFTPEVVKLPHENLYYHGYWINKRWFSTYREENLADFTFPEIPDEKNRRYAELIANSLSVGIHIRRTDFLDIGWGLPDSYYLASCRRIISSYPDACFFVFSDDLHWCEDNAEKLGLDLAHETTYIEGNIYPNTYIDMQLMSMCQGLVLSQSSFVYLAALLNQNLKFWINPTKREI